MKLTLHTFHKFSQGDDIKADIKGGWCAGVTALVSHQMDSFDPESGYASAEQWLGAYAVPRAIAALTGINEHTVMTQTLQAYLGRVGQVRDVTDEIHLSKFDGRTCKVLMSVAEWIPVLSTPLNMGLAVTDYFFKTKFSIWHANHIGVIVRGGRKLVLLEPNYGLGIFDIGDSAPLSLADITKAIAMLAWKHSYAAYLGSCSMAISTLDESGIRGRLDLYFEEQAQALFEQARAMFGDRNESV